jgi:amidohydrolase
VRPAGHPLLQAARQRLPEIVALRRELHRQPEIGLELPRTQAAVAGALEGLGLEARPGRSVSSLTAVIEGARPGPTMLLRADMDGLPLQEETDLPFSSEIAGAMHACGHDTHVAMLMGAARLLLERRAGWPGRVVLMFQPGEEGYHGARSMIEEGLLDGPEAPAAAFALHISNRYATGTVDLRPGPLMASADRLIITVRGRGGHASTPHLALDPIPVAAAIVQALQVMVTRRIDLFDPAVITIAAISAGTTNNIIPETASMDGTIRTISEGTRSAVHERIREVCSGIAAAYGAEVEAEIVPGYPVTENDSDFTELVTGVAEELAGADRVVRLPAPIMGAEDFSYVLQRVPGAMAFIGARPDGLDPETAPQNHSNRVVFDEEPMALGAAMYAGVALRYLAPHR